MSLAVVRDLRVARALVTLDDLAALETDVLAGFVLARAAAGLADSTIASDVVHLEQIRAETDQNRGRSTFRAPGDPPEPPGTDHPGTDHAPGVLRRTGCQGHHGRDYGCAEQR